jgi:hypothetical protein
MDSAWTELIASLYTLLPCLVLPLGVLGVIIIVCIKTTMILMMQQIQLGLR